MKNKNTQAPSINRIGLLGASFDTGNHGVSALAESSIKCILHQWPNATIDLLASGRTPKKYRLEVEGRSVEIENLPVRFCKTIFMKNHYIVLFSIAILLKVFRFKAIRNYFTKRDPWLERILKLDMVADITGGDSFSDIYGTRRFIQGALLKYLWLLFGIRFYFLPQTYGPFKRGWVRCTARCLLKKAERVYSRDQQGYAVIEKLFGKKKQVLEKVKVVPDVAFVLDPSPVQDALSDQVDHAKQEGKVIIGLNVNGLLYSGGYTRDNMFLLSVDYPEMVREIVSEFLKQPETVILLIPHVRPSEKYQVESDLAACRQVIHQFEAGDKRRILLADADYDHKSIKSIIGRSHFFMGSRMHSCIAAMSQCVPTVGLAYSNKFQGVFDSIGQGENILDLRTISQKNIPESLRKKYIQRDLIAGQLGRSIPGIQRQVIALFAQ
jgi:polysaccharide pyruvyl transferase WcaK-like protein